MKYRTILADPPWSTTEGFGTNIGRTTKHYPLMPIGDICNLPVSQIVDDSAVLILWVIWPQAENAFKVVHSWGFEFVTGFPWIKLQQHPFVDMFGHVDLQPVYGTGAWVRGCTELVYVCKRGAAKPPWTDFIGLLSARFRHSKKPTSIYEYAELFEAPRIELFCREKRAGWHSWGNEIESDISLGVESGSAATIPQQPQLNICPVCNHKLSRIELAEKICEKCNHYWYE